MRIGEILVQKKLITPGQLEIALEEQKKSGEFLGMVLVARRYMKEEDLLKVLSDIFRVPFVSLTSEYVNWDLAMSFTPSLIMDRQCFPFQEDDYGVRAAILNPLDAESISQLEEQAKKKKIRLVLVTRKEMKAMLSEYRKRVNLKIKKLLEG